jgi:GntR family transcriptional regulator
MPVSEADYVRVANHLRATIRSAGTLRLGEKAWTLVGGAKLPTKNQLCEIYGANTNSIDRAMIVLRTEGFVVGRQGLGVFVEHGKTNEPPSIADQPTL